MDSQAHGRTYDMCDRALCQQSGLSRKGAEIKPTAWGKEASAETGDFVEAPAALWE
ncbi:MAG: hypothetical protein N4A65_09845 [Cohaesibacter sp.]|nr:hypothetical protein [Cohaesibacter sp.]